jgi:predicted ArsR family transcriptional regulator
MIETYSLRGRPNKRYRHTVLGEDQTNDTDIQSQGKTKQTIQTVLGEDKTNDTYRLRGRPEQMIQTQSLRGRPNKRSRHS